VVAQAAETMALSIRPIAAPPPIVTSAAGAAAAPHAAAPGWWCEGRSPDDPQQQRAARLLWQFNCRAATFTHPSWISAWIADPALIGHPACSAHLLARHGLEGCHDWHCDAPAKRLWLLDGGSLSTLAVALGGVAQAPLLRRAVRRERRAALQAAWPATAWDAAHDPLAPRLDGLLPATAAPSETGEPLSRLGAQLLRGLLEPGWRAVAGRARLRLPRPWADDIALALPAAERSALLNWITAVWIPQRSASWAWLF
jgi:hypothetical protein